MDIETRVRALEQEIEEKFPMKDCPKCEAHVSMVRIETWSNKSDGENFSGYRCLKCGIIYEEVLQEVIEEER